MDFRTGTLLAAPLAALTLFGCAGNGGLSLGGGSAGAPEILVLSNRADLISGGDALVQVRLPAGQNPTSVTVSLNGQGLNNVFATRPNGQYEGLVTGLRDGANLLKASYPGGAAQITITNHSLGGPLISGAQIGPWTCTTRVAAPSVNNPDLGAPLDDKCSIAHPVFRYQYKTLGGQFAAYDPGAPPPPAQIAKTTTDAGAVVPYIVRIERGVMNRGKYDLAYLANPADPAKGWTPWTTPTSWNRKLFWKFGSGCDFQRTQAAPGTVMDDVALSRGFMVASSEMTQYGTHCNDVTSAETVIMLKEYITEQYGLIRFTMSDGGSGGAHQQNLLSSDYPGLIQGMLPTQTFQDTWTPGREFADCGLLSRFYAAHAAQYPQMARAQIDGHRWNQVCDGPVNTNMSSRTPFYMDPAVGCNDPADQWKPTNLKGVRCTLQDFQIAIFGPRDATGYAKTPQDNLGIQYGFVALNNGAITPEQFVLLNEQIGGYDINGQWQAKRMVADPGAVKIAYSSGRISGGRYLGDVAIIDRRDFDITEEHYDFRPWVLRNRLLKANGDYGNQVIWRYKSNPPDLAARAFDTMNKWLTAIEADHGDRPLHAKILAHKPAEAVDSCWRADQSAWSTDAAYCNTGPSPSSNAAISGAGDAAVFSPTADQWPVFRDTRVASGEPLASDILKCALKPLSRADYKASFTDAQWSRLQAAFPQGVCDYSKPGIDQQYAEPWQTFMGGPGGAPLGPAPHSVAVR